MYICGRFVEWIVQRREGSRLQFKQRFNLGIIVKKDKNKQILINLKTYLIAVKTSVVLNLK